jgi:hypothetical protein
MKGIPLKTLDNVKKINLAHAKDQNKPIETNAKIIKFWTGIDKIATEAGIIPADLRVATKPNAQARRTWCEQNPKSVLMVDVRDIQRKTSPDRVDAGVRGKLKTLKGLQGNTTAKRLGYVRVLNKSVADRDPSQKNYYSVYIYRLAK